VEDTCVWIPVENCASEATSKMIILWKLLQYLWRSTMSKRWSYL
jgi:hypothetical protein